MRIVLWNCNNGLGNLKQIEHFKSLKPDLAIIPELKQKNIERLAPSSHFWTTNNHENPTPKGLGILAFSHVSISELPRDEEMEIYVPLRVTTENSAFNLLAVWNFYSACKQGRFKGVKGENCLEWSALRHFKNIFSDPCVIAGDWNFGPTFSTKAFKRLVSEFSTSGIRSLYHEYNSLSTDLSSHSTYKTPTGHFHHLDHIFGSEQFCARMTSYIIEDIEDVVLSDHAPIILDVDL